MDNIQKFVHEYRTLSAVLVIAVISIIFALTGNQDITRWLLSVTALSVAAKLGIGMIETLRNGSYGIDILAVIAILSTVAVGEVWAAIVIVIMLTGGEALEDYAARRAKKELSALLDRAPQIAHILQDGATVDIALSAVKIDDQLLVKPGEVVPVDASLISESAELDESSLTGESLPVEKVKGDELLSGAINGGQAITIRAIHTAQDSQYQQILELVKAAADSNAPFVRLADRYAVPFTIVSLTIAAVAWLISGDPLRFAQVLVVATPCPLLLGAPIALISGMSRAAKNGIIIKNGATLEQLAEIRAVAFDKTGTLTHGEPQVQNIIPTDPGGADELLTLAASAEQQSTHVLSRALVASVIAAKRDLYSVNDVHEVTAAGVSAMVNSKKVLVGKSSFLEDNGVVIEQAALQSGETAVYVAQDNRYIGVITFTDIVRDESKAVIEGFTNIGITETFMLTGDSQGTAEKIASQVGITTVKAECLPLDKVNFVKNIATRPVLMVGDGINDAPVLAVADVGMAMGARGSTAASESADVVVLVDDISKSLQAVEISKNTLYIAKQSIMIGIAISVGLMLVASTGAIPAVVGAGLQEVVDVVVIFNALRAHGSFRS